jgi:omega-6 fatty acid desaturase (delta-12 desaturase)
VREYQALPRLRKFGYRLYRSAWVLLFVGPVYQFAIKHRFPFDIPFAWKREWASVLWNNLALAAVGTGLTSWLGWEKVLLVQLPIIVVAGAAGVWLFYVQHQFEEAYWERQENWDPDRAAVQGSSFFDLPRWLHWFTGNIGFHHVHHLNPRIPFYRLPEAMAAIPELQHPVVTTLRPRDIRRCFHLNLWDPASDRMVGYREAASAA